MRRAGKHVSLVHNTAVPMPNDLGSAEEKYGWPSTSSG